MPRFALFAIKPEAGRRINWKMVSANTFAAGAAKKRVSESEISKSFDKPAASWNYAAMQVVLPDAQVLNCRRTNLL
jgi:hypothetical protein